MMIPGTQNYFETMKDSGEGAWIAFQYGREIRGMNRRILTLCILLAFQNTVVCIF
jgi:hypothetical protein